MEEYIFSYYLLLTPYGDGGRNQKNLLTRLIVVFSLAIGASNYRTLSYRSVATRTDPLCLMECQFLMHLQRTSHDFYHQVVDHKAERMYNSFEQSGRRSQSRDEPVEKNYHQPQSKLHDRGRIRGSRLKVQSLVPLNPTQ